MPKKVLKWSRENVIIEAKKYDSKVNFMRGNNSAYKFCLKKYPGLIDELFVNQLKQWPKEAIICESSKYSTKKAFSLGSQTCYQACITRFPGLIDELFESNFMPDGYWTKETIAVHASKHDTKKSFMENDSKAYRACHKNFPGYMSELFYEGNTRSAKYKGLTDRHSLKKELSKFITRNEALKNNKLAYQSCSKLFPDLIIEIYGEKNSWTRKTITDAAKKCSSKIQFFKEYKAAYDACLRRFPGLIDELFDNQQKSWTKAEVIEEAKKYNGRSDLKKRNRSAYNYIRYNHPGLIEELYEHKARPWTKPEIIAEAKKYQFKQDFEFGNKSAYQSCTRNYPGLIDELFINQATCGLRDTIYIWKPLNENNIYKLGITSSNIGRYRLRKVAQQAGFKEIEIISKVKVGNARLVESKLLKFGKKVINPMPKGRGLCLDSTAIQHIWLNVLLWLLCPTHRGAMTRHPYSSSPAG